MKPHIVETSDQRLHRLIRYDINHKSALLEWRVKFKEKLNPETVNSDNVYVYNELNQKVRFEIAYDEKTGYIIISPAKKYEVGKIYTLELTPNVKLISNKGIGRKIQVRFAVPGVGDRGFDSAVITNDSDYSQDSSVRIEDRKTTKKKSRAPAVVGIGTILSGILLYFLLFGATGDIKGYVDTNGNKYYYTKDNPEYDNINEREMFTTEQKAEDAGYIKVN